MLELTPVSRGIEREGLTPVTRGTGELLTGEAPTPLLVLGNGGGTRLGRVPRNTELGEAGIVVKVPGPVDGPATTLLVFGTAVMLPGLGYGASVGIAGGLKDGKGEATHSYPRGPTTSVEEGETMVTGVEMVHNEEPDTRFR